jgi:hypothetical protein
MLFEVIGPGDRLTVTVDIAEAMDMLLSRGACEIAAMPVVD